MFFLNVRRSYRSGNTASGNLFHRLFVRGKNHRAKSSELWYSIRPSDENEDFLR